LRSKRTRLRIREQLRSNLICCLRDALWYPVQRAPTKPHHWRMRRYFRPPYASMYITPLRFSGRAHLEDIARQTSLLPSILGLSTISMSSRWHSRRAKLVLGSLAFANYSLVTAIQCSGTIYGCPEAQDCMNAIASIPFASSFPHSPNYIRPQQLQVFSEPQYLQPPFASLSNTYYPNAIVQLPKIWRHSR